MFFTAVNPMDIQPDQREVGYDLDKPRIAPYKHTGELITIQYIGAIESLLRESDCDSIKLDRMQLLLRTHYQRFV